MIKREWPQHWPDMLKEMEALTSQGVSEFYVEQKWDYVISCMLNSTNREWIIFMFHVSLASDRHVIFQEINSIFFICFFKTLFIVIASFHTFCTCASCHTDVGVICNVVRGVNQ